jgi:hypothetical protein
MKMLCGHDTRNITRIIDSDSNTALVLTVGKTFHLIG